MELRNKLNYSRIYCRSKQIGFGDQNHFINQLHDPDFKGTMSAHNSWIIYANQLNKTAQRSIICKQIFVTLASTIYTSKYFYLLGAINDKFYAFKAAGLVEYWNAKVVDKNSIKTTDSKQPQVITMEHLLGCFQTWLAGMIIGAFIFILEKISQSALFKYKNCCFK